MKVGTDAVLLGAWMPIPEKCDSILDIGSGCGVVSLMLAQRTHANITGIDIDENSVKEAQYNAENSPWKEKVQFIHENIQNFVQKTTQKFDVIVSNPPFFENSLKSPETSKNISKHNDNLSFETLISAVDILLSETGRFGVIIPTVAAEKMKNLAFEKQLFTTKKTYLYPTPAKKTNRILMMFERKQIPCEEDNLVIRDKGYTEAYRRLVKEYLLVLLSAFCFLLLGCASNFNKGDLVFVASEDSDFEKSIAAVTKSDDKTLNFTHVGIINATDSGIFIIEAVPDKGVVYTNFKAFKEENRNGILCFASLKPEYKKYASDALNRACSHIGKEYDYAFDFENDLYYCSELVYDAYAYATNDPNFFETPPMTFKNNETGDFLPYWIEYFENLNLPVPEGKPGINPTGLSHSEKLGKMEKAESRKQKGEGRREKGEGRREKGEFPPLAGDKGGGIN